ncbi:Bax inhibitor 1-related protein [Kipferlia bialata]|uniref:Bax inhibitor 1-related protein n=1 Tax=Kipferlia bialata TaxID=797122 RepID=A0A9K3GGH1_9EUKA|nr:Bax inhibitor 1-related protein [Kipferlia bialata]|eukprot:g4286.t1
MYSAETSYSAMPVTSPKGLVNDAVSLRLQFIRKVYALMLSMIALVVVECAIFSLPPVMSYFNAHESQFWGLYWTACFAPLIELIPLIILRKRYPVNLVMLYVFAGTMGITCGMIVAMSDLTEVLAAATITLGVFGAITVYAFTTDKDFTYLYPMMFGLLIGALFACIWSIWIPFLDSMFCFLFAAIFSVYLLIDTQLIAKKLPVEEYVLGAITLFLDVLNIFMYILMMLNN